ncbi:GldM family protein [Psychroserpens sp.]
MRKLLILLSFLFLNICIAQEVSLELSRENIIMRGITVPIKVTIENIDCKDVIIKSEEAEISKGDGCKFNLVTRTENREIVLNFYKIKRKDTVFVEKKTFRVRDLPKPTPTIAGLEEGEVSIESFKKYFSIARFDSYSEYICMNFKITEYTMMIVRDNQSVGISKNLGNRASEDTKQLIQLAKTGDKVYIVDLKCKVHDEIRELDEIKFDIVD